MYDIPCVIFAGGRSSRMGEDKALLPFGEFNTLTEFQLNRLQKIFKTVYISTKSKDKFNFKANFILDAKNTNVDAPTAGFLGIYEAIKEDAFFVISVDTPFISIDEIDAIIKADSKDYDATIAKINSKVQPMCGIYHRSLENKFIEMFKENNHKLGLLLKNSNTKYLSFYDEEPFMNLNFQHEYQKALELLDTN